jgi:alpha-galactosidase
MDKRLSFVVAVVLSASLSAGAERSIRIEDLDVSKIVQPLERPRTTGAKSAVTIAGRRFERSVSTRAKSRLYIALDGKAVRFSAWGGISDEARDSLETFRGIVREVRFAVYGDGKLLAQSAPIKQGGIAQVKAELGGVRELLLTVDGPAGAFANWADARVTYAGATPQTVLAPEERGVRKAPGESGNARINGAAVVGIRPGTPLFYPIAATGHRAMQFSAAGLPAGLRLAGGIISGTIAQAGEYVLTLGAKNARSEAKRPLRIVVGSKLALTPPMGWNSWNVVEGLVSATVVKEMADALVRYGFRDAGYQYINIDDVWAIGRDAQGRAVVDPGRFPDGIKSVADYVHARGLKLGIYSSPGPTTCAGYPSSYGHEEIDVQTWAAWDVDYVKYDACGVAKNRAQELFLKMGTLLQSAHRSMVYSLSGADPTWGEAVHAQLWRTTTDIRDQWRLRASAGILDNFDFQPKFASLQHPGAWNDPDLLVIGIYGKGGSSNDLAAHGATDTEYRSQMSLWCLLSAPLMVTADLRTMGPTALETLTNPEVTDLDQDALGRLPKLCARDKETQVWRKDMQDGSTALALFNRGGRAASITVKWSDAGLHGRQRVRDLWKHKDLGTFTETYAADVAPHETVLLRAWRLE